MKSVEGNGRPSKKDAWSVEKYAITASRNYIYDHARKITNAKINKVLAF
jgi:hypothetical protein